MFGHEGGILVGLKQDPSKIYVNFYDRKLLCNSNVAILGYAGEGKSYYVSKDGTVSETRPTETEDL